MTRRTHTGAALLFVLMALALVGAGMVLLTGAANNMIFESRRMLFEAHRRSLRASGVAWARAHPQPGAKTLDVKALGIEGAALEVKVLRPEGRPPAVQVTATCRLADRPARSTRTYLIEPP